MEASSRILNKEFFRLNSLQDLNEGIEQMGGFLFEYNHLRRRGEIEYMSPFVKLLRPTGSVR
jgi:hypothetical protein